MKRIMNKRVLFVSTYGDFLVSFEMSNIRIYLSMGYEVHSAANFSEPKYNRKTDELIRLGVIIHDIPFVRKPWSFKIFSNIKLLKSIVKENNISVIDCHNAVCGVIARHVASLCKIKKVIYTPHSFFFYDGCPTKNKLLFKPIEKHYAKKTDLLVTINQEDYKAAQQMKLRGKAIYIPGVGIDVDSFSSFRKDAISFKSEFNIKEGELVFCSVGELIPRKNHIEVLEALSKIDNRNYKYIICGFGSEEQTLRDFCLKHGLSQNVVFAGYRSDVPNILHNSDVFLFPSKQEGLPVALMEAMASNVLCVVSKIRGNVDLITDEVSGFVFELNKPDELLDCIKKTFSLSASAKNNLLNHAFENIRKFDVSAVSSLMENEYNLLLNND